MEGGREATSTREGKMIIPPPSSQSRIERRIWGVELAAVGKRRDGRKAREKSKQTLGKVKLFPINQLSEAGVARLQEGGTACACLLKGALGEASVISQVFPPPGPDPRASP